MLILCKIANSILLYKLFVYNMKNFYLNIIISGEKGFEPLILSLEDNVLPLHHSPNYKNLLMNK